MHLQATLGNMCLGLGRSVNFKRCVCMCVLVFGGLTTFTILAAQSAVSVGLEAFGVQKVTQLQDGREG